MHIYMYLKKKWCTLLVGLVILYCEFLADYLKLWKCSWPHVQIGGDETSLRAMILADPHLLGPYRGHWLDKLYREWHMKRAFHAATNLFQPDVVFILGDLFDEGDFVNDEQFHHYVQQFRRIFYTTRNVPIISAVGNHDVGFHYKMHRYYTDRFKENFNNIGVNLYTIKGVHFVIINSMAMQNDECIFCKTAMDELQAISSKLECIKSLHNCSDADSSLGNYSRPILLQHFPTYRISDEVCKEHDSPVIEKYRENWEVLSKKSTDQLGKLLRPRLAFSGHSHHYCLSINRWNVREYTVASFNWRNKVNPSFLLTTFSNTQHAVTKCSMVHQETVFFSYLVTAILIVSILTYQIFIKRFMGFYSIRTNKFRKNKLLLIK